MRGVLLKYGGFGLLLGRMGNNKQALQLIIEEQKDVQKVCYTLCRFWLKQIGLFAGNCGKLESSSTHIRASGLKVTVQFERCFRLMEHISVISSRNTINVQKIDSIKRAL